MSNEPPFDSVADVFARLSAFAREMDALGIGVTIDVRITVSGPERETPAPGNPLRQ